MHYFRIINEESFGIGGPFRPCLAMVVHLELILEIILVLCFGLDYTF